MLLLLADEGFNNHIVRGVRRRNAAIDFIRVQEIGLSGADDPTVLEWAAQAGRVVFTHDVTTMFGFAFDRVRNSKVMPGLFGIYRRVPIRTAIEEILLLAECSLPGEWEGQVRYLPLL